MLKVHRRGGSFFFFFDFVLIRESFSPLRSCDPRRGFRGVVEC